MKERDSIWKSIDWFTILIYLCLLAMGWMSVCGASYDFGDVDFLSFSSRAGKQLVWMLCSFGIAFIILMLDNDLYRVFAYLIYTGLILLLIVTIFVAPDTKGSRSWLIFGPVSLQPAEFAKFATALCLAKFMGSYNFVLRQWKNAVRVAAIILLPFVLIVMQKETGSALVYTAFLLVLYREGMPGFVLYSAVCAVLFFVVGIKFGDIPLGEVSASTGRFSVLLMIIIFTAFLVWNYTQQWKPTRNILVVAVVVLLVAYIVSKYIFAFELIWAVLGLCGLTVIYLTAISLVKNKSVYFLVSLFTIGSVVFLYSCDYFFNDVLKDYQRERIKVTLGMEEDRAGTGYNVNQSMIAIGSGGLTGKGFLNGTQTKLKYVPEQDTDFIFCTIGEEQGFLGSSFVLLMFLTLILRLVYVAERQPSAFGRVYGYSVLSILLFHLFINVGMVTGLTPVIGIPLPFFSYGGSSLWGFTILLFIFLRIDASRKRHANLR